MTLTPEQGAVLARRSSLNKIAVPVDRSRAPPDMVIAIDLCIAQLLLVHVDRATLPHTGIGGVMDIYAVTPAGIAAIMNEETDDDRQTA